jgi:hypothetical protein
MRGAPTWPALLAALPDDAVPERKPVASTELIASGKADAIIGWDRITINLSAGDDDEPEITSTPSQRSHEDIMALNVLVAEVLRRAPKSAS